MAIDPQRSPVQVGVGLVSHWSFVQLWVHFVVIWGSIWDHPDQSGIIFQLCFFVIAKSLYGLFGWPHLPRRFPANAIHGCTVSMRIRGKRARAYNLTICGQERGNWFHALLEELGGPRSHPAVSTNWAMLFTGYRLCRRPLQTRCSQLGWMRPTGQKANVPRGSIVFWSILAG